MNAKFFYPLLGLSLGIFITADLIQGVWFPACCLGLALLIWIVIYFYSKNPISNLKISNYHFLWILLLFCSIGSYDYLWSVKPYVDSNITQKKFFYEGVIEEAYTLANGDKFKVKVISMSDSSGKNIFCKNLNLLIKTNGYVGNKGDIITFPGKLNSFYTKDYSERMRHQGINFYANIKAENINKIGETNTIYHFFDNFRNQLTINLEKSTLKRETKGFLISFLLGQRNYLSPDIKNSITSSGLAHVLALSGLHIGLLISIIFFFLFPLSLIGLHKTKKILVLIFIWIYVCMTGFSPTTVRAAIMATLLIGALILERKNSSLNSLLAAVFIIILFDPTSLWDIGLQLSFICVASIIVFTNKTNPVEQHIHPNLHKFINLTLVTIITTFCTWTLIAYYFKSVSLLFLPANIILLPILPFYFGLGLLYLVLITFGIDINILSKVLDLINSFFVKTVDLLSFSGYSSIPFEINTYTLLLWLMGILLIAFAFLVDSKKNRKILSILASFTLLISVGMIFTSTSSSKFIRFQHSFTKLEIHIKDSNETQKFIFPRNNISKVDLGDIKILSIDQIIHRDSIISFKNKINEDCLFVGPNADIKQIADLLETSDVSRIIFHSGVGKNKKEELFHLIEESKWDKTYFLRETGSLEFEL